MTDHIPLKFIYTDYFWFVLILMHLKIILVCPPLLYINVTTGLGDHGGGGGVTAYFDSVLTHQIPLEFI